MLDPRLALSACLILALFTTFSTPAPTSAEIMAEEEKDAHPLENLEWRNVGPVNMSGRVADVEGVAGDPRTVYVGAAGGGLWKTTDGGLTFAPVFDDQAIASIGDLAVAPSNPEVVYVGTGEASPRNSVSYGDGVYKSTDGGTTWTHVGLEETRHISRVLVHPEDPDTVWVGALGHIYGPNEERGVFKTTDGGETWEKVLYLDDRHGVADMDLDPKNPNVLVAALWLFERKPWTFESGSEDGGVFRSVDGGSTWKKLEDGLPKLMGRVGVRLAPSDPKVVYVIAESNDGTLFRSDDGGASFRKVYDEVDIVSRGFYYTKIAVDPTDANRLYAVSSRLFRSIDGGKSFERISRSTHVDYHALWIDPENPHRLWQGQDGGVAVSYDRGDTWEPIRNLPIGQFYQIFYDHQEPFYVLGGGLQDNGTWYGPSRTREPAGILPADWRMLSFGDAYFVVPHPEIEGLYLSESQGGSIQRADAKTRQIISVSPQPRRNDGGPVGELEHRFNWNAPIVASPHDPTKVYFAGNVVFETTDFGDTWRQISPDLTTDDPEKQGEAGGPVWFENTTAEYHTTIISLAESPAEAGMIWVGTDDGRLHVTKDGGGNWTDVTANVPGVPEHSPVSHVEPSRTGGDVAYVAFDRHMFDDLAPYIFKTTDGGQSFTRLEIDVEPSSWVWVVREDPKNPDLLYAGTELGLIASYDAGATWRRLHLGNLPTVSVHDIRIHPRENDLLLGTHGRAIWVLDDATPVQQWEDSLAEKAGHLFPVRKAIHFTTFFTRYGVGDKRHVAPNPPYGALLTFHVGEAPEAEEPEVGEGTEEGDAGDATPEKDADRVEIVILDTDGEVIRTLKDVPQEAGLHRLAWDLREDAPRPRREDDGAGNDFFRPLGGPAVLPGVYTVRLTVDGESSEASVEVGVDPDLAVPPSELVAQHRMASRLTEMQEAVNDILRGTDIVSAELTDRRATVKRLEVELEADFETRWSDFEKRLAKFQETLTRPEDVPFWSAGPRLSGRLSGLFRSIDTAFAAPTKAQEKYLRELEGELSEAETAWTEILGTEVPEMNEALEAAGVPSIAVPSSP